MFKTSCNFQSLHPKVPKRYLLFVIAFVWTFAGGMLLYRGFSMLMISPEMIWIKIAGSFIFGIVFYRILFARISLKHTHRIVNLKNERPGFFLFFSKQSYIMMAVMISFGITLRTTGIISPNYLSLFYISMGTPISLSAFRFYYYFINYKEALIKLGNFY